MADVQETRTLLIRAEVEYKKLLKSLDRATVKLAETRAAIADSESLQNFLREQIEDMED